MQRRSLIQSVPSLAVLAATGVLVAGCGGGGGGGGDPAQPPSPAPAPSPPRQVFRTFAYVANYTSGDVSVYEMGDGGALIAAGVVPVAATANSIASHPSGRFLYVVSDDSIFVFSVNPESGMLRAEGEPLPIDEPGEVLFHPAGKFAYVGSYGSRSVLIFSVAADTGVLVPTGASLMLDPVLLRGVGMDPLGRRLYVTSSDDRISSHAINAETGQLGLPISLPTHANGGPITLSPSGSVLYVNHGNEFSSHTIAPDTGELSQANAPRFDSLLVESLIVDPLGRFACAITADQLGYRIRTFTIEAGTGALLSAAVTPVANVQFASVALSPLGDVVYGTEVLSNTVHQYSIDHTDFSLAALPGASVPAGREPDGIVVVTVTS